MQQKKKIKKVIATFLMFSLLLLYGSISLPKVANAIDAITDAKDTISDSDISAPTVTHTVIFTLGHAMDATDYFDIAFPTTNNFGTTTAGNVTCPAGMTASVTNGGATARCTSNAGTAAGPATTTIIMTQNPDTEQSYAIDIESVDIDGGSGVVERVQLRIAILQDVLMTARVDATLTFTVSGLNPGEVVNGVTCNATSTASTTPFGTLNTTASTTVCQQLSVATNADDGYSVTVFESDELTSDSNSNINSFNNSPDDTGSTTPGTWVGPTAILDAYHTYGHMGLTSEDVSLDASIWGEANPYNVGGDAEYVGFNSTDPIQVMYHTGPSAGTADNTGITQVAYTAEISGLQEAGDYETTLTYICTPTF